MTLNAANSQNVEADGHADQPRQEKLATTQAIDENKCDQSGEYVHAADSPRRHRGSRRLLGEAGRADDQWSQRERRFDARQCARDHTLVVAEEPFGKDYHDEHDGKPGCERDAWRLGGASSGDAGQSRRRAERSERARIELREALMTMVPGQ
jgi:hypothetical protein